MCPCVVLEVVVNVIITMTIIAIMILVYLTACIYSHFYKTYNFIKALYIVPQLI